MEHIEEREEDERRREEMFFELAERFWAASDAGAVTRLGDQLGRVVFGE